MSRFQAVAMGSSIVIHTHRSIADVLLLDTATEPATLQRLPVQPDTSTSGTAADGGRDLPGCPPSRGLHSCTAVGDTLYIFGGAPQKGPMLDDLWALDLGPLLQRMRQGGGGGVQGAECGRLQWRRLQPPGEAPEARASHAAVAVGDQLLIAGETSSRGLCLFTAVEQRHLMSLTLFKFLLACKCAPLAGPWIAAGADP